MKLRMTLDVLTLVGLAAAITVTVFVSVVCAGAHDWEGLAVSFAGFLAVAVMTGKVLTDAVETMLLARRGWRSRA